MVEYTDSSQNNSWHFTSKEELEQCRAYTNYRARQFLYQRDQQPFTETMGVVVTDAVPDAPVSQNDPSSISSTTSTPESIEAPMVWSSVTTTMIDSLPISCYVCHQAERMLVTKDPTVNYLEMGPWSSPSPNSEHRYITPQQETILIDFYGSKISSMIGPNAEIKRLRRESKVVATAAMIYRRFYLSNSVLLYDPKIIMVAATFLACKIEDVTADIRYIEQGTQLLNAPVTIHEIVTGEIILLSGINYHLLCYHSYKSTLALTEDLRTFLKTSIGQQAFTISSNNSNSSSSDNVVTTTILSGQDLKPMYDQARTLLDLIIVSDVPLLYSPGQIGIAALTVAHNEIMKAKQRQEQMDDVPDDPIPIQEDILCRVYLPSRFPNVDHTTLELLPDTIICIADEIRTLQKRHNQITQNVEQYMTELKTVHKQLKKVRVWGNTDVTKSNDKKKSKKRSAPSTPQPLETTSMSDNIAEAEEEHRHKRMKAE
jgi:cyclin H